jgi:hypothetical protein
MSQTEKPQKGKPTTIYIYPDEWKNYQSLVKEKLGLTAGQRLMELMRKGIVFLEAGKHLKRLIMLAYVEGMKR